MEEGTVLYLAAGIHAQTGSEEGRNILRTTNYLDDRQHLPVGTRFTVLDEGERFVTLECADGRRYRLEYRPKHIRIPFREWMNRQFSRAPVQLPTSLTSDERACIEQGLLRVGMSREAVFLAVGYPPASLTSSLEGDSIVYAQDMFRKVRVEFGRDGCVARIVD